MSDRSRHYQDYLRYDLEGGPLDFEEWLIERMERAEAAAPVWVTLAWCASALEDVAQAIREGRPPKGEDPSPHQGEVR